MLVVSLGGGKRGASLLISVMSSARFGSSTAQPPKSPNATGNAHTAKNSFIPQSSMTRERRNMTDLEGADAGELARTTYAFRPVALCPTRNEFSRPMSKRMSGEQERFKKQSHLPILTALMATAFVSRLAGAEPQAQPPNETQIQPPATTPPPTAPAPQRDAESERVNQRLKDLEEKNRQLQDELSRLKEEATFTQGRVDQLMPISGRVSGYVDFGFFYVQGNGTGIRSDTGNIRFPEYQSRLPGSWVFMGDPLSTAVNSRGEPADVGESRAVTFNPIGNEG